jgi:hypothetical protein
VWENHWELRCLRRDDHGDLLRVLYSLVSLQVGTAPTVLPSVGGVGGVSSRVGGMGHTPAPGLPLLLALLALLAPPPC